MTRPCDRKELAQQAVAKKQASIRLACATFGISETCYRYERRLSDENAEIADWLLRLTNEHKRWGFALCFLHLRNVKGFGWNHKRMYRIYMELGLHLRIRPRHRMNFGQAGQVGCSEASETNIAAKLYDISNEG